MKRLNQISLFILVIFLISCEKEIDWKLNNDYKDYLVVDGILTNEFKSQQIKLSHSYQDFNSSVRPYSGANILVSDSEITYEFKESADKPGNYFSIPFRAVTGKTYNLTIRTDSVTFIATASAIPLASVPDLKFNFSANDSLFTFNYSESSVPTMSEVFYDWEFDADFSKSYGFSTASQTYYTLNNVDVNKAFQPDQQIVKLPAGTKVVRKTYSLSAEHQEFLRSLLMETEWRGGLFDIQAGNVNTNLSNDAKGFFAVCTVITDSTVVR